MPSSFWFLLASFPDNNKAFKDRGKRFVCVINKFGTLAGCKNNRGVKSLETSDRTWTTGLTNNVDSGANTNLNGKDVQILVKSNKKTRANCWSNEIKKKRVALKNKLVCVDAGKRHGEKTTKRNGMKKLRIAVRRAQSHQSLAKMRHAFCNLSKA